MVILSSANSGTTWTTAQTNVGGLVQNGQELILNPTGHSLKKEYQGTQIGLDIRDGFGLLRYGNDNLFGDGLITDDGFLLKPDGHGFNIKLAFSTRKPLNKPGWYGKVCQQAVNDAFTVCMSACAYAALICAAGCAIICAIPIIGEIACLPCYSACLSKTVLCGALCWAIAVAGHIICYEIWPES